MSSDLRTALILDSRIADLTDQETFGVASSGQNVTFQQYASLSASPSLVTFQCQIPSESIVVDRHVLMQSTMTFQIAIDAVNNVDGTAGAIPAGSNVWNWGLTEAFGPFPLTESFSTMQATINNASVSINIGDVLPQLLRMTSQRELQKYNSYTPAFPDSYFGNYSDAAANYVEGAATVPVNSVANPLGSSAYAGLDNCFVGRGCFPTSVTIIQTNAGGAIIAGDDGKSPVCVTTGNKFVIVVSARLSEPLMLSPFLNCVPHGTQSGFMGLNTLTLNFNVNNLQRCLRTAQTIKLNSGALAQKYRWALTAGSAAFPGGLIETAPLFQDTRLLCQFITLNPSQSSKIALRNVCEFTDFPRFITASNNNTPLAAATSSAATNPSSPRLTPSTSVITSNNLQLNQIPSRFIICVRNPPSAQGPGYADCWAAITNISINFNNKSGILASCPAQQLWQLSAKAGSTQTWQEFSGVAEMNAVSLGVATAAETVPQRYISKQIATTGSLLVLDAVDLGLPDELAPGSLGQYNFQCNVSVANYQDYAYTPELCIIVCNEGIFSTIAGSSSIQTGLLSKSVVLSTKEQEPATDSETYRRFVGGVMSNSNMANASALLGKYYKKLPAPLMAAISGGGMSGGASSGGRRHLSKHFL